VFAPVGLVLHPEIAALLMSGSTALVTMNALLLKRVRLPVTVDSPAVGAVAQPEPVSR
jgi:Cu2+-exporting ATPase